MDKLGEASRCCGALFAHQSLCTREAVYRSYRLLQSWE